MRAYRLAKARYADVCLDGSGAKSYGGRWNSKGVAMVYASDTVSLAALELLAHLHRSEVLNRYLLLSVDLPDAGVMTLDETAIPADWRADPPPASTAAIGDEWVAEATSLALSVPSALVPRQWNILINPAHPAFQEAKRTVTTEPFDFDPRLAR
ncbi:MAG: RES domain-containing protein [Chromatiaceae bacterium]|jgi:RES domain-containing protein